MQYFKRYVADTLKFNEVSCFSDQEL